MVCALTVHVIRVVRKLTRAFFKKLPVGGGGGGAVYIRDLLVMTEGTRKLGDMLT